MRVHTVCNHRHNNELCVTIDMVCGGTGNVSGKKHFRYDVTCKQCEGMSLTIRLKPITAWVTAELFAAVFQNTVNMM